MVWDLRHMFGTRVRIGPTTPDGRVEVELRGQSPWLLAAEIAGFGSLVEVLDPIEVREQLARLASELAPPTAPAAPAIRSADDARRAPGSGGRRIMADDLNGCRRHAEAAFRGYRDRGDLRAAARRRSPSPLHDGALGNTPPAEVGSTGLGARSTESVRVSSGAISSSRMACDRPDVDELEASADRALAIALEFSDHDLEVRALADGGVALITQGRVREGFDRLDSTMAAISAGEVATSTRGPVFCSMLTGCDRAAT